MPLTQDEFRKIAASFEMSKDRLFIDKEDALKVLQLYVAKDGEKSFVVRRENHKLMPALKAIFE